MSFDTTALHNHTVQVMSHQGNALPKEVAKYLNEVFK